MALNDILTSMDGARDALVTAINAKGGSLADNATLYQCADAVGSLSGGGSSSFYKVDSYDAASATATATQVEYDITQSRWTVVGTGTVTLSYKGTVAENYVYYALEGQIIGDPVGRWYDPDAVTGTLYVLGDNTNYTLGLSPAGTDATTLTVSGDSRNNWVSGGIGWQYHALIDENNDLWFCGNKDPIGIGSSSSATYEKLDAEHKWSKLLALQQRLYALTTDGYLYRWRSGAQTMPNSYQLKDFCMTNSGFGIHLLADGSLRHVYNSVNTVSGVGGISNFVKVSGMAPAAMALTEDGKIYLSSNLTSSTSTSFALLESDHIWKDIAASGNSYYAIDEDGKLYSWCTGSSGYSNGQLGLGDTSSGPTEPTQVGVASNWKSIFAGSQYMHAINAAGELYTCGKGYGTGYGSGTYSSLVKVPLEGKALSVLINTGATVNAFGAIVQE